MDSLSAVVLDMKSPSKEEYSSHSSPSKTSSSSSSSPSHLPTQQSLSMKQMLLLNAVVCGVEICACAGFTYIPPMLLKAGFSEERMGFILGSGPLLGFLFVPVIGRASDRCYSPYGRRRPFIVGLAVLLVVSLYLIPFGEYFASLIVGVSVTSKRLGVWALASGVILLDFTTQACLTPCEALLNDAAKHTAQSEKIFTVYSLMVSLGGVVGYLLTAIDWTSNTMGEYFGGQEASIFSLLIVVFTLMLSATLFVARETPLTTSPGHDGYNQVSSVGSSSFSSSDTLEFLESPQSFKHSSSTESIQQHKSLGVSKHRTNTNNVFCCVINIVLLGLKRISTSILRLIPFDGRWLTSTWGWLLWLGKHLLPQQLRQLFLIPSVLKILAMTDFCFWSAVMCFNIYYTDYMGQIVYEGNPNAPETSPEGRAYDEGVRIASWGLLLHCICSAVFSFFIEGLTETYGYKRTMQMGMVSFVCAMGAMVMIPNVFFVNLMAAVTGFAYSTVTTIPFMLVSKYHANKKIYFNDLNDPERGIGSDMAVLDWSYFLSQVFLTVTMGGIVHLTGTVTAYMASAGFMGIMAVYLVGNIIEDETEARRLHFLR